MRKELSVEEVKERELELLKTLHEFCDKNGLRYYLAYGSLIGAIRHKGFIPWDDDIDVLMPYEDYCKLIQLFNGNSGSQYQLISREINKEYYLPYGKLVDTGTVMKEELNVSLEIGIYLDIFPFYNLYIQ